MTAHDAPGPVPEPGTVAEEAARLVDLLSQRGWGGSTRTPSTAAPCDAPEGGPADAPADGSKPECTCGGATPAACRVCPVCQVIAFVQQVNPETIERVADFVGFAATALRDLATAQRERRSGTDGETDRTRPGESS